MRRSDGSFPLRRKCGLGESGEGEQGDRLGGAA